MGSECSADEREFRYLLFHQAIYAIENDIKNVAKCKRKAHFIS